MQNKIKNKNKKKNISHNMIKIKITKVRKYKMKEIRKRTINNKINRKTMKIKIRMRKINNRNNQYKKVKTNFYLSSNKTNHSIRNKIKMLKPAF